MRTITIFCFAALTSLGVAQVHQGGDQPNNAHDFEPSDRPAYTKTEKKTLDDKWNEKRAPVDYQGPNPVEWNETTSEVHFNSKRTAPPGVYVCTKTNFKGVCHWYVAEEYVCNKFDSIFGYGSFGVDHGIQCKMWDGPSCGGIYDTTGKLTWPGVSGDMSKKLNTLPGSVICPQSWMCRDCPDCDNSNAPDWDGSVITFDSPPQRTWKPMPQGTLN